MRAGRLFRDVVDHVLEEVPAQRLRLVREVLVRAGLQHVLVFLLLLLHAAQQLREVRLVHLLDFPDLLREQRVLDHDVEDFQAREKELFFRGGFGRQLLRQLSREEPRQFDCVQVEGEVAELRFVGLVRIDAQQHRQVVELLLALAEHVDGGLVFGGRVRGVVHSLAAHVSLADRLPEEHV